MGFSNGKYNINDSPAANSEGKKITCKKKKKKKKKKSGDAGKKIGV